MALVGRRTRRGLLTAAGAVALAASGCGPAGRRGPAARPVPADTATTLVLAPYDWGSGQVVQQLMQEKVAGFEQAQGGRVRVKLVPGNGCCDPGSDMNDLVAGTAPDVFTDNGIGNFRGTGLLLPLDPYLEKDNLDTSLWSKQQIASLRMPEGLLALPTYFNIECYIVNLGAFDAAGVSYPDPSWSYQEFTAAAQAMTVTAPGRTRYGCDLDWGVIAARGNASFEWVLRGFGGSLMDDAATHCLLADPANVAAGRWVFEQLVWPGVGTLVGPGSSTTPFATQQTVMCAVWSCCLTGLIGQIGNSFKWNFYPQPMLPKGRTAFGGSQAYAISAATRQPDLAWELLKWLTVDPTFQRLLMRLLLVSPGLNSLWGEWAQVLQTVAPPLKGKALHAFSDAAQQGYAYTFPNFAYANIQAMTLLAGYMTQLSARKTTVEAAFTQAAAQIDALEAVTAAASGQREAAQKAFPTSGPPIAAAAPGV